MSISSHGPREYVSTLFCSHCLTVSQRSHSPLHNIPVIPVIPSPHDAVTPRSRSTAVVNDQLCVHPNGVVTTITSHLNPQLFYVSLPSSPTTLRMPTHRQPKCTSAGRVTSRMLLSFLLLSTPITASGGDSARQQQQPLPILPPSLATPQIQDPGSNEHVFVSHPTYLVDYRRLTV